jgi:type 1 fimbria pilin
MKTGALSAKHFRREHIGKSDSKHPATFFRFLQTSHFVVASTETNMHHLPIAAIQDTTHHQRFNPLRPPWAWLCLLILLPGLFAWPATALAQAVCYFQDGNGKAINAPAAQIITFNSVTIPLSSPPPAAGSNIGLPRTATATGTQIVISCPSSTGTSGGVQPSYGTYNPTNNTFYSPTPGVAFQILRAGNPIQVYPNGSLSGNTTTIFSNNTTFQLISTGVLPSNGNQIPAGTTLGQWQFNNLCTKPQVNGSGTYTGCTTNSAVQTVIIFQSGGVTITASTCSVSTGSQNVTVTLPSVSVSALGAVGATAGTTRFGINLTGCSSSLAVSAMLSTSNPFAGPNGVITSTTGAGYAGGVGIQILQPNGVTPVTFDTAFPTGTTSGANSNYTFNLYARYYQTTAPVTPGQVQATATYTLTYQ